MEWKIKGLKTEKRITPEGIEMKFIYKCEKNVFTSVDFSEVFLRKDHLDSNSKEYIASLNDPKAFEGVNLGILKRTRKSDLKDRGKIKKNKKMHRFYQIFKRHSCKNHSPYCLNCRFYRRCYKDEFGEDYYKGNE